MFKLLQNAQLKNVYHNSQERSLGNHNIESMSRILWLPNASKLQSCPDIIQAQAIKEITEWLHVKGSNVLAIATYGPSIRRVRNAPARGIVWDCRVVVSNLVISKLSKRTSALDSGRAPTRASLNMRG
jgi:hypothetical protein